MRKVRLEMKVKAGMKDPEAQSQVLSPGCTSTAHPTAVTSPCTSPTNGPKHQVFPRGCHFCAFLSLLICPTSVRPLLQGLVLLVAKDSSRQRTHQGAGAAFHWHPLTLNAQTGAMLLAVCVPCKGPGA